MQTQKVHSIKGQIGAKNGYAAIVLHRKMLPSLDQIPQRAHEIYAALGGAQRMTLADWLKAEQELKRWLK